MSEAAGLIEKAISKPDLVYIQTTEETARNEEKARVFRFRNGNTKHIRMLVQENTTVTSFDAFK
ncbi:hypothetical protein WV34_02545 [Bacillus amyloliquefaciens]|nr:hypothetical protein WV34_02545 [Bacillus amyloliquefaciens]